MNGIDERETERLRAHVARIVTELGSDPSLLTVFAGQYRCESNAKGHRHYSPRGTLPDGYEAFWYHPDVMKHGSPMQAFSAWGVRVLAGHEGKGHSDVHRLVDEAIAATDAVVYSARRGWERQEAEAHRGMKLWERAQLAAVRS